MNSARVLVVTFIATVALVASFATGQKEAAEPAREVTVVYSESALMAVVQDSPALQEIRRQTGIRVVVEGIPESEYQAKKRMLISTNNMPDVLLVQQKDVNDFASTGVFLPLRERIKKQVPSFTKIIDMDPVDQTNLMRCFVDNELYAFPQLIRSQLIKGPCPNIRTDLLKRFKLEVPTTWDGLARVLKRFKEELPNTYPMITRNGINGLFLMAYPMGAGWRMYYDKDADGGKYLYGGSRDDFRAVLEYFNRLYKEGVLDRDYAVVTSQQWQERLSSGRALFYFDNPSFLNNYNKVLQAQNREYLMEPIPVPATERGLRRALLDGKHNWDRQWAVSSKAKDVDTIMRLFDFLYSAEGADATSFGVLGEHYTKEGGEYKVRQAVLDKYAGASDPLRAMYSALGTSMLAFCAYEDKRPQYSVFPLDMQEWYRKIGADKAMHYPVLDPPFAAEERKKITELRVRVDTYIDSNINGYIMGEKNLNDWPTVAQEVRKQGAAELEAIYNQALQRLNRK